MQSGKDIKDIFKAVSKQDVRELYLQICRISEAYKAIKSEGRTGVKQFGVSLLKMLNKSSGDKQAAAEELKGDATQIYKRKDSGKQPPNTSKGQVQEQEQHTLAHHSEATMFNVQPVNNIDELDTECEKLKAMKERSHAQNRQLQILEQLRQISKAEGRVITVKELDHYKEIADKYVDLIELLEAIIHKAKYDKGEVEVKLIQDWRNPGKKIKKTVRAPISLAQLIDTLNKEPDDHHLLRMAASVLKNVYSPSNQATLLGIALFDHQLHNQSYTKRKLYSELKVPDSYNLESIEGVKKGF